MHPTPRSRWSTDPSPTFPPQPRHTAARPQLGTGDIVPMDGPMLWVVGALIHTDRPAAVLCDTMRHYRTEIPPAHYYEAPQQLESSLGKLHGPELFLPKFATRRRIVPPYLGGSYSHDATGDRGTSSDVPVFRPNTPHPADGGLRVEQRPVESPREDRSRRSAGERT